MLNVLHFAPADAAHKALEADRSWMALGSALVISHNCRDGTVPEAVRTLDQMAARSATQVFQRYRAEIEATFFGLELPAPLDTLANWNTTERTLERRMRLLGGVGILTT